ncbi:MAG: hypothetical protein ACTSPY_10310 [Candidatus Helarchaeota archaeon]
MKSIKILGIGNLEEFDEILNEFNFEIVDTIPDTLSNNIIFIIGPVSNLKKRIFDINTCKELYTFIIGGGTAIFIIPPDEEYLNYLLKSTIFDLFKIEPEIISKKVLLHKTEHIINISPEYYKSNKKAVDKYVHFLTYYENFQFEEILIEGEYEPVYYIYTEGKGKVVFYGLDLNEFKKEKIVNLIKYLLNDYSFYWKEINYDSELFRAFYQAHGENKEILQNYIDNFLKTKHFRDVLQVKDEDIKLQLINSIDNEFLKRSFDELNPVQLEKQYKTIFKKLNKKKYRSFISIVQKYLIKRIGIDRNIPKNTFNRLYEADILPEEAASLIIFYIDPKTESEIDAYLKNLNDLIKWNKYIGIFDDEMLRKLKKKFRR